MLHINNKSPSIIGGVLLVIGNVIGVGILALPIAIAQLGLLYSILMLCFFWILMTIGAHYLLEANLAFPHDSNLISMSKAVLGRWGVWLAWTCNLLVMYSLLAAYISGGGDLIKINLHNIGISLSTSISCIFFLMIFGFIVYLGISITDYANRLLMLIKLLVFLVILKGLSSYFNLNIISILPQNNLSPSLLIIVLTSFGFAVLIPSLRKYYQSEVKKIKKIIFFGTFIPFLCYVIWITLIFSVLPYHGLEKISASTQPISDLQRALSESLHIQWIIQATNIFSSICIITSFFANSISFTDFIADGLGHTSKKTWLVYFIAYLPALVAVLFYQKAFLMGLSIAATFAIIQLLILPGMIVWFLRYRNKDIQLTYSVLGGKPLLAFLLMISIVLLGLSFL